MSKIRLVLVAILLAGIIACAVQCIRYASRNETGDKATINPFTGTYTENTSAIHSHDYQHDLKKAAQAEAVAPSS